MRKSISITTAAILFAWTLGARAQPDGASAAAARAFMAQGRSLRAGKDLRAALESFRSADELMHVPTTAIEVARTQVALGWLIEAKKTVQELLATETPEDEPPPFTLARLAASSLNAELSRRIPRLRIQVTGVSPKMNCTVWADGTLVDPDDYAHRNFNPGKHTIVARAGAVEAKQFVEIEEGQAKDVVLDLGMDAPEVAAPTRAEAPRSSAPTMVYVLGATAVVSFGVAGTTAFLEHNREQDLKQVCAPRCTEQDIQSAKTLLLTTNVSLLVGGASAVTALIWYLADKPSAPAQHLARSTVPFDVQPTPGGAFVGWRGSF